MCTIIMNCAEKERHLNSDLKCVLLGLNLQYLNVENLESFQFGDVVDLPLNLCPSILMKVSKATQADLNISFIQYCPPTPGSNQPPDI